MHGFDSRESSHPAREAHSKSQHSSGASGAMEETSGKVQNASTHILRGQNHEHAHSSRSVQGPVQWGNGTLHVVVRFAAKVTICQIQRTQQPSTFQRGDG